MPRLKLSANISMSTESPLRSHSSEDMSHVIRVIEAAGESEIEGFLDIYGAKLEPAIFLDVRSSLRKRDLKARLFATIRLCQGIAYGADCAAGLRLASALLLYMRGRWEDLTQQDGD